MDPYRCEYKNGCDKEGTELVYSRHVDQVLHACLDHARIIVDEGSPEYTMTCQNCGCFLPVN